MVTVEGPFASEHVQYVFQGSLPGGESWSCGVRTEAATPTHDQLQAASDAAAAAFFQMWSAGGSIANYNPTSVTYNGCMGRLISTAGKTLDTVESPLTPSTGSAGTQGAPNQSALVLTLLSARAGRSGKGRMYLPLLSPAFVPGTDRLVTANVTQILNACNTMITAIGDSGVSPVAYGPWAVSIQSRVAPAQASTVNRVAMGDVVDTQRRRRDKVKETYLIQPIAAPH